MATPELDAFRAAVSRSLAVGDLAGAELEVVDVDGRTPVVVALDEERLPVLLRRIEAVGGYANVFVRMGAGIGRIAVMDVDGALDVRSADDMRAVAEQPSPDSTVGAFVAYLMHRPGGAVLPARLATATRSAMPARQVEIVTTV
ncbi:hypothetical protein [Curtobacterium sp. L1-20]|uniref:hypothetical protein n=1 Tax=Curtobacterium sp. L1-20 TaxID=3138181 RepID=UPI003B52CD41